MSIPTEALRLARIYAGSGEPDYDVLATALLEADKQLAVRNSALLAEYGQQWAETEQRLQRLITRLQGSMRWDSFGWKEVREAVEEARA